MRFSIDKLVQDLVEDNEGLDVISSNLKNLEFVLNKIIYIKSHSVNMMFKDAIVLKKEALDKDTIDRGMKQLSSMMENALKKFVIDGGAKNLE